MKTDGEEIHLRAAVVSGVQSGFRKTFLLRTITNTDRDKITTNAHEVRVQSAVMSGLEDVNSYLLGQI